MERIVNKKSYIITVIIQLVIIGVFSGITYFMFGQESIILNPVPYTVGLGLCMIIIDLIILMYVFKNCDKEECYE